MADEDDKIIRTVISEPSSDDEHIQKKVSEFTRHEDFRQRILAIAEEYSESRGFITKVKEYAGEEYENRVLKSARYWTTTIVATIITSALAAIIALLIAGATGSK